MSGVFFNGLVSQEQGKKLSGEQDGHKYIKYISFELGQLQKEN